MSDANWYSEEQATFGDRLAAARDAAGLTQRVLSKKVGVKLTTLQNWEEDLSEPRANRLAMLSGLLGVSVGWLLMGEGEGLTPPPESGEVSEPTPEALALGAELRKLHIDALDVTQRLARLEKRMRKLTEA